MTFLSIKTKLFFVFIIISIIPVLIVTLGSYRNYTNLVSKQVSLVSSNAISSSVERVDNILQNIERITITFQQQSQNYSSTGIITVADQLKRITNIQDQFELFTIRNNMRFIFQNLLSGYSYINGIYLFIPNGQYISYGNGSDLKLGYSPIQDMWYLNTIQKNGTLYISDVDTKNFILNAKPSITFSRALYDTETHQFLGVLMLDCSLDIFKGLDRDILPNITSIYLVNGSGKILFNNSEDKIGQFLQNDLLTKVQSLDHSDEIIQESNAGALTVIKSFPDINWKVVSSISLSEIKKQFGTSRQLITYISLTCAVIFILLSIFLSNLITRPVTELSIIMRKNKSHKLVMTKKQLERMDEIGILYTEYNNMIRDINAYIKDSYQNKLLTLNSQMKALEAQINSHFLYNTLESINSIAEIEEIESIATMTKALGDMFRYSIKTKSELVNIDEELSHANNYLAIQKIRYEEKMEFILDIQEGLIHSKILKLVVQPLIENAIYHGLESKRGKGRIVVRGYVMEDKIYFDIIDDGVGMTPGQVQEVRDLLAEPPEFSEIGQKNKPSIGLKNVHSRISLYYGPEYGLILQSQSGIGTTVTICIPKID
ncbi:sensor histidine kinase [Paenibacillus sp. LMG 31461]|uniref:Sensor histidine kinase n=1 Tax=Paenibacillus plantarum TaxID=2654975 RepID=A0ABX1XHQ4_9BACL|nr:sensor histidine kinase [Paenibacillus plantarum]NOU67531.1 sensor histidine kinase [Paenibacillus plantarum]